MMIYGFDPISAPDARVLILGTLPGQKSVDAGQYYAHPNNSFWFIMERLFAGRNGLDYAERKALLIGARVALWDVLHAAERCGSVDSNIVPGSEVVNDFATFFARHPGVCAILFNGGNAEAMFHRFAAAPSSVRLARLPSTSPANARLSREAKLEHWKVALAEALNG